MPKMDLRKYKRVGVGRPMYVKAKVSRVDVKVSVVVTMVRLLRTEWVSPFVLCTSPHPNDTHGRAPPAKLHALGGPLALSVLSECYLTQNRPHRKPISITRSPIFEKKKKVWLIEHGDTHHIPTYIARGGHFDRPAHSREFRLRRGGVPVPRDVDRGSAGPRRGGARVVRDAHGERDDAHHFVQVRVAEAL